MAFQDPIEEIRAKLDIVDVIGSYIKLQKAGANYRAVCPFHSEKKPSLFVSPARQIWKCFGCGAGGDMFGFVKQIEGVEFRDALKILASRAGVELKKMSPEMVKWNSEKSRLFDICELSSKFFETQLWQSEAGKRVREYLKGRGVNEDSMKKWKIGYAPKDWRSLMNFLIGKGYKENEIEKIGVIIKSQKGGFYDRFRKRIMFPIFSLSSQVVGFGGRVFEPEREDEAKYINTPQTPLYDKSSILYGLDKAKVEARKKDFCILVEGYMDAVLCHQAGFENTAAVSGTALTSRQLKVLKRYSDNLYTAFDMDIAGNSATKRGIDMAQKEGFNIKVTVMPEDKDPADIVLEDPKKWQSLVESSKSIMEFYFQRAFSSFKDVSEAERKVKISKMILPEIKKIPNEVEKSYWLQELSNKINIREEDLRKELDKVKKEKSFSLKEEEPQEVKEEIKNRKSLIEERMLYLLLKNQDCLDLVTEDCLPSFSEECKKFVNSLKNNLDFRNNLSKEKLTTEGFSDNFKKRIDYIYLAAEVGYNLLEEGFEKEDMPDPKEEMETCIKEIKKFNLKEELNRTSIEIRKAESENNFEKLNSLTKKFRELSKKIII
jgi:DNA primase